MKPYNNNSAFTLIEIIVVLIIVGILAAIALPNMFANVQRAQAASAIATMDGLESQIEGCAAQNNTTPQPGGGLCSPATFGVLGSAPNGYSSPAVQQAFWFDIAYGPGQTGSGMLEGHMVFPSGTPSAGNLTYTIAAYKSATVRSGPLVMNTDQAVTITRATDGSFTCSAPPAPSVYAGVC